MGGQPGIAGNAFGKGRACYGRVMGFFPQLFADFSGNGNATGGSHGFSAILRTAR
ncbi:hypothetical protein BDD14_4227 [Edaphobacter modestus]|uniref:Uncharacterized protein n=1 Tax=Edaphobacter modestus TaxID=388466 RepID=A0A4V2G4X0_9BACT|nr:hypothetical protein BDD14_4227 [Edaphobacter modestus]